VFVAYSAMKFEVSLARSEKTSAQRNRRKDGATFGLGQLLMQTQNSAFLI
jgi:hypothetical protein